MSHHHATQGGLWWHTVQVMEGATAMAIALGGDGPLSISYDAVALGALLHDVGKGDELRASGGITAAGRQATHVLWGALRLQSAWDRAVADGWRPGAADEALLTEILHVVASHHGTLEWGANTRPISREAWLVHCADLASAHVEKVDNACRLGTEVEPGWVRPVAGWSRDAYRVISAPSTEDTTAADVESVLRSLGGSGAMPHAPAHDVITQETEPNTGSGHSDDDSPQTHAPTLKLWHGRPTPVGIALATITNTTEA